MSDLFSAGFGKGLVERAVKTFAQSLGASLVVFTGLLDVDWQASLGAAGLATLLSVLTTVGGSGVSGEPGRHAVGR